MLLPSSLDEAVAGLAAHPDGDPAGGWHRPAGRGQRGASPLRLARRRHRCDRARPRARAVDVDVRPSGADGHLGGRGHVAEIEARAAAVDAAGAGRGGPHGRLPADPQRRHARWQPRHLLAGGRRAAGARRARRHDRSRRRRAVAARCLCGEFMLGVEAHGARTRRADRVDHGAAARRLAGLRQGRRAQRDGHRHRQRLPGRRRRVAIGAARARLGRARRSSAAPTPRRYATAVGRLERAARSPTTSHAGSASWLPRRPPDRRPPLDRRVPAPRRRRAGARACCSGRSPEADG